MVSEIVVFQNDFNLTVENSLNLKVFLFSFIQDLKESLNVYTSLIQINSYGHLLLKKYLQLSSPSDAFNTISS